MLPLTLFDVTYFPGEVRTANINKLQKLIDGIFASMRPADKSELSQPLSHGIK